MTDFSPNLALPFLQEGQGNADITHNESLLIIDILLQGRVLDRDLTAPPGSPAEGDAYIVEATATGDWTGQEDNIAYFFGGVWNFIVPKEGWRIWVNDEALRLIFLGGSWVFGGAGSGAPVLSGRISDVGVVLLTSSLIGATFSIAQPSTGLYNATLVGVPAGDYYIDIQYNQDTGGGGGLFHFPKVTDLTLATGQGTNTGFTIQATRQVAAEAFDRDVFWSFSMIEI